MVVGERAITVRGLTKRYADRLAVDHLEFDVGLGEVFAIVGPNGAGKTTTVEILEGYRAPDGGVVRVLGLDPMTQGSALKPRIGLMLQDGGIYPSLRPLEALRLFAALYACPADPHELLRLVGLEEAVPTRYRQLSGGEKQRLSLALALVGRPELVFLDEPTTAMDPRARRATWDVIRDLKRRGVTVVLTTHFMDEAERLADRVAILDAGRLAALDSPAALGRRAGAAELRFSAVAGLDLAQLADAVGARAATEERPGVYAVDVPGTPATVAALATWLADRDVLVSDLRVGGQSLEDVYLRLTGDSRDE